MSIQDFLEEAHKRTGGEKLNSTQQEVHDLAIVAYRNIKGGHTAKWVKLSSKMLVQSIAPDLSVADTLKATISIEGIALTVLSELFEDGTLIKREEYKDETQ